jgi:hypothetical protein
MRREARVDLPPPEGPSRRTFQQEPLARVDSQADALEDGSATVAVAKHQVVRLEHGLVVP